MLHKLRKIFKYILVLFTFAFVSILATPTFSNEINIAKMETKIDEPIIEEEPLDVPMPTNSNSFVNSGISSEFLQYTSPHLAELKHNDHEFIDNWSQQNPQVIEYNSKAYTLMKKTGSLLVSDSTSDINWRYATDPIHNANSFLYENEEWIAFVGSGTRTAYAVSNLKGYILQVDLLTGIWTKVNQSVDIPSIDNNLYDSKSYTSAVYTLNNEVRVMEITTGNVFAFSINSPSNWRQVTTVSAGTVANAYESNTTWNNLVYSSYNGGTHYTISPNGMLLELSGSGSAWTINERPSTSVTKSNKYFSLVAINPQSSNGGVATIDSMGNNRMYKPFNKQSNMSASTITWDAGLNVVSSTSIISLSYINGQMVTFNSRDGAQIKINSSNQAYIPSKKSLNLQYTTGDTHELTEMINVDGSYYAADKKDGDLFEYRRESGWTVVSRTPTSPTTRITSIANIGSTIYALSASPAALYRYTFGSGWTQVDSANPISSVISASRLTDMYLFSNGSYLYTIASKEFQLLRIEPSSTRRWEKVGDATLRTVSGNFSEVDKQFYKIAKHPNYFSSFFTMRRDTGKIVGINLNNGSINTVAGSSPVSQLSYVNDNNGQFESFTIGQNNNFYLISKKTSEIIVGDYTLNNWENTTIPKDKIIYWYRNETVTPNVFADGTKILSIDPTDGKIYENGLNPSSWRTFGSVPRTSASSFGNESGRYWTNMTSAYNIGFVLEASTGQLYGNDKYTKQWVKINVGSFKKYLANSDDFFSSLTSLNGRGYALTWNQGRVIEFDLLNGNVINDNFGNATSASFAGKINDWSTITSDGNNIYVMNRYSGQVIRKSQSVTANFMHLGVKANSYGYFRDLIITPSSMIYFTSIEGNTGRMWKIDNSPSGGQKLYNVALPQGGLDYGTLVLNSGDYITILNNTTNKIFVRQQNDYWYDIQATSMFANEKSNNFYTSASYSGENLFVLEGRNGAMFSQTISYPGSDWPGGLPPIDGPFPPGITLPPGMPDIPEINDPGPIDPETGLPNIDLPRLGIIDSIDVMRILIPFIATMSGAIASFAGFGVIKVLYRGNGTITRSHIDNSFIEKKFGKTKITKEMIDETDRKTRPKI